MKRSYYLLLLLPVLCTGCFSKKKELGKLWTYASSNAAAHTEEDSRRADTLLQAFFS